MIVIPMAGLSSRFGKAGYDKPKYMLEVEGVSLFDHAVLSFGSHFATTPFLFIYRDVHGTARFLTDRIAALGIRTATLVGLDSPTKGQADTVRLGLSRACVSPSTPITIFNIDTIRLGDPLGGMLSETPNSGCLEVFHGLGDNWSFVRPDPECAGRVLETTEKRPVSTLCCTGVYHFAQASDFLAAFVAAEHDALLRGPNDEIYVAPLYNHLIGRGLPVDYVVVAQDDVIFAGVPAEYEALLASPGLLSQRRTQTTSDV